ncbi:BTAD domain-containing putative transcriptional regulator [Streptomyces sp. NPDC048604]|uniref:AfsR/SARP family transcriptional regulator n=1 Tax=Streptomyces sp. NPDC048604 TaxID=3365578 RepID=UPI0037228739
MSGEAQGLRIDLLGPLRAGRDAGPLDLGPVRRQALLAALVLRAGTVVSHEQLLGDVWGTEPPGTGRRVLPSYVYALRKALDPAGAGPARSVIRGERSGYSFLTGTAWTDVAHLKELAAAARGAQASGALAELLEVCDRGLALFRGEPLSGLPGPLAGAERHRLAQQRRSLHRQRAEALIGLGRYADALDGLAGAGPQPDDEAFAALHMRALYGSGRQAEALAVFQRTRTHLVEELGVEPGEELQRVHRGVLRQDTDLLLGPVPAPPTEPPAPDAPRPRVDLPGDTAGLVGRERELALLTSRVPTDAVSVVTVDGTAGVGKTALVVRAAWRLHERYPDGCLFIDLHAHAAAHERVGPQRALYRLLRALTCSDDDLPDELDELVAAWRAATSALRLLVVVDDAPGTAEVRPLLPAGPGSTLIVASRRHLPGLDADVRLTVEPLGTDSAVGLLRQLLGPARADREPEAARELARRCGGLPLALRIAGARLQHRASWTTAHLVGRMSHDESSLRELSAGDRSVEAAFRQSYDQLAPELQRCFRATGLSPTVEFDGLTPAAMLGCSRGHAEHLLEQLVDASLLRQPKPGRYRLHDLVRVHAGQLAAALPEQAAADRAAVLHLYTAAGRIAAEWGPDGFPTGPDVTDAPFADWSDAEAWLNAAGAGLVDVVAYAAAAGMHDHACWIAEGLSDHLLRQGRHHECRAALELALGCADTADDRRMAPSLRNYLGMAAVHQGRFQQAYAWFTDALRLADRQGDARDRARAIAGLGVAEWPLGRTDEAVGRLQEATRLAARLGDDWLGMVSASNLGALHGLHGRHEQALGHYADALAYAEKTGRPGVIGKALCFAADAQVALGRPEEATELLHRAAELAREADDLTLLILSLSSLGLAEDSRGDAARSLSFHQESVSLLTGRTSTWLQMLVRTRLGAAYAAAGRRTEAHQEYRTALSLPGAEDHPREHAAALLGLRD